MHYNFVPMNAEQANTIVANWKYDGEYSIYDYSNKAEAEHMLDATGWGKGVFAVLNGDGDLIGELSIEFFDENDQHTEYEDFIAGALNDKELWIGFGLAPELTGQGLGTSFVSACVEFAVRQYRYEGEYVGLGVATFNKRAITVYERAGFQPFAQVVGEIAGVEFPVVHMRKNL